MNQFALLRTRRFAPFFATQALGAFNDNAFRNATLMLVAFGMGLSTGEITLYSNLALALFILPFFLFSASAGQLAEKLEKTRIIRWVKLFEIAAMIVAACGFLLHSLPLLLVVLFMMGVHSTVFGPIKYAILPQALRADELVGGNGMVEMGTSLAVLLGMVGGNALMAMPGDGIYLASAAVITVAVMGYAASRAIPPAPATAPELQFNWNPFAETARVLRIVRDDRTVFVAIIGISWFWFFGSVYTAQLPNYTRVDLGGGESVSILVLALFAIGTGTGSLLCEKLSRRRVEPGIVPLGAFGLSAFGIDLFFARRGAPPAMSLDWLRFLAAPGSVRIVIDLLMLGVSAGLFVVPLFALVQSRTAPSQLSRVIAGNNVINAIFIVIAALGAIGLQRAGVTIPQVFLITALLNALMAVYLFVRVPEFATRFLCWVRVRRETET